MNDRRTIDTINSDQLDELYDRVAQAEQEADASVAAAVQLTTLVGKRAEKAEAALARVRAVLEDPNHSNMILTKTVRAALAEPGPAATGATQTETTARVFAGLHHSAEQDVTRVINLYERWVKAGPPPLGVPLSRWWDQHLVELHQAILPTDGQAGCRCHNIDELCSGCRRCPDICHGCDGPEDPNTNQPKEQQT